MSAEPCSACSYGTRHSPRGNARQDERRIGTAGEQVAAVMRLTQCAGGLVAAITIVGLATVTSVAVDSAEGSKPGAVTATRRDDIAFVRGGEIYVVGPDGRRLRKVIRGGDASDPAWSFDRKQIAFMEFIKESDNEIGVVQANGTGRRNGLFNLGLDSEPAWSPDDRHLAVAEFVGGFPPPSDNSAIVVVSTRGRTTRRELTKFSNRDLLPSWSPNGRFIAFERDARRDGPPAIFKVRAKGGPATRLT